jgi:ABC-type transporter Mla subunit MlaD
LTTLLVLSSVTPSNTQVDHAGHALRRAAPSAVRFFRDLSALMAGMEDATLRAEALMEAVSNLLSQHMEALNALLRRPTP